MATFNETIQSIISSNNITAATRALRELGLSMREIDILMSAYKLEKRNSIENITFGVEIETINVSREEIAQRLREAGVPCYAEGYNHTDHRDHFKCVSDASLVASESAEVVSPILKGKAGLETLAKVCTVLNEIGATVNKSCGLHVHFGLDKISEEQYKNIFYNYAKCESVIDSFMPQSRRNNTYCLSFRDRGDIFTRISNASNKNDIASLFANDRYYKVNPVAYRRHNTIEFRQHSGTVESAKILNWIEFLKSLIAYSKKNRIEVEPTTVAEIPFIKEAQRAFYEERQQKFARAI